MNDQPKQRTLPLWGYTIEVMHQRGIVYDQFWPAEFFESHLSEKRNTMRYDLAVSKIRQELEKEGFELSGQGFRGTGFKILPARINKHVIHQKQRRAGRLVRRAFILGTNTDTSQLTPAELMQHRLITERAGIVDALMRRRKFLPKNFKSKDD